MRGDSFNCAKFAMGWDLLVQYLLAYKRGFFFFIFFIACQNRLATSVSSEGTMNSARNRGEKGVGLLTWGTISNFMFFYPTIICLFTRVTVNLVTPM